MKGMKKLLSILMVLTLVLSLGASAFAAGTQVTITDSDANSTYTAYKLLNATYNPDTGLYMYTLNDKYTEAIKAGFEALDGTYKDIDVSVGNQSAVVDALSKLTKDSAEIRKFADAVFAKITEKGLQVDATATGKVFSDLEGYYLIAETVNAGDNNTVTSLVMLDTAGKENIEIAAKEEHPSSEKKVQEKDDSAEASRTNPTDWQDAADYDIGDQVPFQLKATIPAGTTTSYTTYALTFHDKESTGLTFNEESVKVYLNGTQITTGFTVTAPGSDSCTFDVVFTDIKTLSDFDAAKENIITVEYTSELNANAVVGADGNPNNMHIEYSNNPYEEGTGKTPDDKVTVFTFQIEANKIDGAKEPLKGAGFMLLKEVPDDVGTSNSPVEISDYKTLKTTVSKGNYVHYNNKYYQVVSGEVTGAEMTKFTFKGEDSGKYLLVETTVPENYNRAEDIEITVKATYDTSSEDPKLADLTVTPNSFTVKTDGNKGIIEGSVMNQTGIELPSTGGIGTTIFYVAGAILVAGAAILLVTKKRVNGAEK